MNNQSTDQTVKMCMLICAIDVCILLKLFSHNVARVTPNVSNTSEKYCKFRIFLENFIFAKSVKRYICNIKNLQLGHDLPITVTDRMLYPFCESFIFTKREIKTLTKISEFTVHRIEKGRICPHMMFINDNTIDVNILFP